MAARPVLNLPPVGVEHARTVVDHVFEVGGLYPLRRDLRDTPPINRLLGPDQEPPPTGERELVARFLYLSGVLDQGRDSVGVEMLVKRVLEEMYQASTPIRFLEDPLSFFAHAPALIPLIESIHAEVRDRRREDLPQVRAYSLYDQYRVTPWVAFRWGAPLMNLVRFEAGTDGLLGWLNTFASGELAAIAIKSDALFGLGKAIGEKASRLIVKWIAFTARIPVSWFPNSYEVPLDANVGRVLMRTGYLFAFLDQEDFWRRAPSPWTLQTSGRVNLSAQSLNDLPLRRTEPIAEALSSMLRSWGMRAGRGNYRVMKTLNVLLAESRGDGAEVGCLDDGFMRIGRDFCFNTDPNCPACPLRTVCLANTHVENLKTTFYCGTGSGVFF